MQSLHCRPAQQPCQWHHCVSCVLVVALQFVLPESTIFLSSPSSYCHCCQKVLPQPLVAFIICLLLLLLFLKPPCVSPSVLLLAVLSLLSNQLPACFSLTVCLSYIQSISVCLTFLTSFLVLYSFCLVSSSEMIVSHCSSKVKRQRPSIGIK